jgi:hypothetical protein
VRALGQKESDRVRNGRAGVAGSSHTPRASRIQGSILKPTLTISTSNRATTSPGIDDDETWKIQLTGDEFVESFILSTPNSHREGLFTAYIFDTVEIVQDPHGSRSITIIQNKDQADGLDPILILLDMDQPFKFKVDGTEYTRDTFFELSLDAFVDAFGGQNNQWTGDDMKRFQLNTGTLSWDFFDSRVD